MNAKKKGRKRIMIFEVSVDVETNIENWRDIASQIEIKATSSSDEIKVNECKLEGAYEFYF
jgi:hypothetical protein